MRRCVSTDHLRGGRGKGISRWRQRLCTVSDVALILRDPCKLAQRFFYSKWRLGADERLSHGQKDLLMGRNDLSSGVLENPPYDRYGVSEYGLCYH